MADFSNVKENDDLLIASGGWRSSMYIGKVARLTKTQIVTTRGDRFNKLSGHIIGGSRHGYISRIATESDIDKIEKDRKISSTVSKLFTLTKVNSETMVKNIDDIIESALELKKLTSE